MEETIGNVLRRVIIPAFSRINDVVVRQMGLSDLYYITFYINDRIDYHDAFMIEKETKNIFNMISPGKGADFVINYKRHEDFQD